MKKRQRRTYEDVMSGRRSKEYLFWRKRVMIQDAYTCRYCGKFSPNGKGLVSHHLNSYTKDETAQSMDAEGATLCVECHKKFHHLYSYDNFNEHDFYIWIKNKES